MRGFEILTFNFEKAAAGVKELKGLLAGNKSLEEKKQIQPFFKKHPDLCALIGHLNPNAGRVDLISFELSHFRDFSCDIALGGQTSKSFTLIELEDANEESLFRKKKSRNKPEWSSRLEHGHSQIIDWLWRLADTDKTDDFEDTFGDRAPTFVTFLIIGRDQYLDRSMKTRLKWRRDRVLIDSKPIWILTYDGLLAALEEKVISTRDIQSPGKPVPIGATEG